MGVFLLAIRFLKAEDRWMACAPSTTDDTHGPGEKLETVQTRYRRRPRGGKEDFVPYHLFLAVSTF